MSLTPSDEQKAIMAHKRQPGQLTIVNAYAGTGKSTTCFMVIRDRVAKGHHVTYVVYNKHAAQDAVKRLDADPSLSRSSVRVRTMHALAMDFLGMKFRARINLASDGWGFDADSKREQKALEEWTRQPDQAKPDIKNKTVLGEVMELWEAVKKNEHPMTFDAVIRLACVDFADEFADWLGSQSDTCLVDECQDALACFANFLVKMAKRKPDLDIVMTGDNFQSIYSFAGAVNAIEGMKERASVVPATFFLSHSFRFGPQVGLLATHLLRRTLLMEPGEPDVQGLGETTVCGAPVDRVNPWPWVRVARANGSLVVAALEILRHDKEARFRVVGRLSKLMGVVATLLALNPLRREDLYVRLRSRKDNSRTMRINEADEDRLTVLKWIKANGSEIVARMAERMEEVDRAEATGPSPGYYYLTTAHGAKGLEFDRVQVLDDFVRPQDAVKRMASNPKRQMDLFGKPVQRVRGDLATSSKEEVREEVRLLYVAFTRARKQVAVPPALWEFYNEVSF